MHAYRMALLPVALLCAACATHAPRRAPAPAPKEAPGAAVPAERPATIAAAKLLEEGMIGETAELTPAPDAPAPPPTPQQIAALPPPAAIPGTGPGTASEPESLLTRIGPNTPPNVAAALRLIEDGRQQMNQGRYDRALDRFERGVAIDPSNAYGYYFLAQLHFQTKKYDQAVAFASRTVALSARNDPELLGRAYGLEGVAFEAVGRYPDARKAYEKAMEADPHNLAARVGMARLSPER